MITPSRRRFLFAAASFLAAPAIVRAASIMPVSVRAVFDPQAVVNERWTLTLREVHFAGGWMLWDVETSADPPPGVDNIAWDQSLGAFTTAAARVALGLDT